MWGPSIVGFGKYRIQSGKKETEWPLIAFSPRKQNFTLYIGRNKDQEPLLKKLGKHKVSGGCLHINNLSDVPQHLLKEIEHFFKVYKELEKKKTGVEGWHGLKTALKIIDESVERYIKQQQKESAE